MFTGIVEEMARVVQLEKHQNNITLTLTTALAPSFNVDQSVSHNGCCLTVVHVNPSTAEYQVTAIHETIVKTNLADWKLGDLVNLERSMQHNGRLDGHIVQGHVDTVGICNAIEDQEGSWKFTFTYEGDQLTVEKGSITVNGVSLTVVDARPNQFSVCIIPYTYEHTTFHQLALGDRVNLEFDIIGKYVQQYMKAYENR
jgi:riboflavin synthase